MFFLKGPDTYFYESDNWYYFFFFKTIHYFYFSCSSTTSGVMPRVERLFRSSTLVLVKKYVTSKKLTKYDLQEGGKGKSMIYRRVTRGKYPIVYVNRKDLDQTAHARAVCYESLLIIMRAKTKQKEDKKKTKNKKKNSGLKRVARGKVWFTGGWQGENTPSFMWTEKI